MTKLYWMTTRLAFFLLAATILTCIVWGLPLGFLPGGFLFITIGLNYLAWKRGGRKSFQKSLYDSIPMGTLFTDIYPRTAFVAPPEDRTVDMDDILVASYVRLGNEFLFTLTAADVDVADENVPDPIQLSIDTAANEAAAVRAADEYEYLLSRWQNQRTSLLLLQSPGTVTVLAESPTLFLPLG